MDAIQYCIWAFRSKIYKPPAFCGIIARSNEYSNQNIGHIGLGTYFT